MNYVSLTAVWGFYFERSKNKESVFLLMMKSELHKSLLLCYFIITFISIMSTTWNPRFNIYERENPVFGLSCDPISPRTSSKTSHLSLDILE